MAHNNQHHGIDWSLHGNSVIDLYVNKKMTPEKIIEHLNLTTTLGAVRWFLRKSGVYRNKFEARRLAKMHVCCKLCSKNFIANSGASKHCKTCCPTDRDRQRAVWYGITRAQYDEFRRRQNDACGLCKISLNKFNDYNVCIDHDHSTGTIRGILCRGCNRMLGIYETYKASAEAYLRLSS